MSSGRVAAVAVAGLAVDEAVAAVVVVVVTAPAFVDVVVFAEVAAMGVEAAFDEVELSAGDAAWPVMTAS